MLVALIISDIIWYLCRPPHLIAWYAVGGRNHNHSIWLVTKPRSGSWPATRRRHLLAEPMCRSCGARQRPWRSLDVHHIVPVHINPDFELEPANLVTLCRYCHFCVGHYCDWSAYNISVVEHAERNFKSRRDNMKRAS